MQLGFRSPFINLETAFPIQIVGEGSIAHHLPLYEDSGHCMAFRMQVGRSTVRFQGSISCFAPRKETMQVVEIGWIGRSFVMAAPVDGTGSQKDGKRRRKEERRIMVESFVQRYRSANEGKFPGPYLTCKEVGGSYYIIREIMQEMIHQHKASKFLDRVDFSGKQTSVQDLKPISVSAEMSVAMSKETGEDVDKYHILASEVETNLEVLPDRGHQNANVTDFRLTFDSNDQTVILQEKHLAEEPIGTSIQFDSVESMQAIPEKVLHEKEQDNNVVGEQPLPSMDANKQQKLMEFEVKIQTPDFSQNASIESQSEASNKLTSSVGTEDSNRKIRHGTSSSVPERSQGERLGYKTEITGDDRDTVKLDGDTDGTQSASENFKGSESSQQLHENTLWGNVKAFTKGIFSFWKKI